MRRVTAAASLIALAVTACGSSGGAVEIDIGATEEQPYPFAFAARGVAVDEGVVCPGGEVEEGSLRSGTISMTFTCSDGSGSFILETIIDLRGFEGPGVPDAEWTFGSGTDAYEGQTGAGTHRWFSPGEVMPQGAMDVVLQVMVGTIRR